MSDSIRFISILLLAGLPVFGLGQGFVPFFLDNGNSHQYQEGIYGCGATFCDFDKDGWDDLSLPMNGSAPIFYRNNNGVMQTFSIPMQNEDEIKHIVWVDYDNDGDRDLCLTGIGMPLRLFRNNGNMSFNEVSETAGFVYSENMTYGSSWGDYDRDGDLDVFVAKYDAEYLEMMNADNELYRNNGDGTFTNVATEAGIYIEENYTFMGLWFDYDDDLWPDLLITNDRYEVANYLFHNNGDGTFTDVSVDAGIDDYIWSMSNTCGDYDNDGDADLYITNGPLGNKHKMNNGQGQFLEVSESQDTKVNQFCWSAQFVDVDNDGYQDLHVCSTPIANISGGVVFKKNMGTHFVEFTSEAGLGNDDGWSRGSAFGDMNNDGFPDLIVRKNHPDYSSFWQAIPNENHWMKVNLTGTVSNLDGIGSRIDCYAGSDRYTRYTHCGESYNAQNSFTEFIGMGAHTIADSILVYWPSGIVDKWQRIPSNQSLMLVEGSSMLANLIPENDLYLCNGNDTSITVSGIWNEIIWFNGENTSSLLLDSTAVVFAEVADAFGNHFLTDSIQVLFTDMPVVSLTIEMPSCSGASDGMIELSGIEEADVMSIVWSTANQTGLQLQNLAAGFYTYDLITYNECNISNVIELSEPDDLNVSITTTDNLCPGAMDGVAIIEVTGGTPDYMIEVEDSVDLSHLASGYYTFSVVDAHGCYLLDSFFIDAPEEIVSLVNTGDVLCSGDASGHVIIDVAGGSGSYNFLWNGLDSLQLAAGNYSIQLEDTNGCDHIASFDIAEPDPLNLTLTLTPEIDGIELGNALLDIQGGVTPYSISWSNGDQDVLIADSLSVGNYELKVTDGNGCQSHISFEIEIITGIETEGEEDWRLYPNPTSDYVFLKMPSNAVAFVSMVDQSGRVVLEDQITGEQNSIRVDHFENGSYMVIIHAGQFRRIFIFTKQ